MIQRYRVDVDDLQEQGGFNVATLEKVLNHNADLPDGVNAEIKQQGRDYLITIDNPSTRNFLPSDSTNHRVVEENGENILVLEREIGHPQKYFMFDPPFFPDQCIAVVSSRISHIGEVHDAIIRSLCGEVKASSRFSGQYTFMGPVGHQTRVPFSRPNNPQYVSTLGFGAEGMEKKYDADFDALAVNYVTTLKEVLHRQVDVIPKDEEVGVLFSGGIDSTTVYVLLHRIFKETGRDLSKLTAHSLAIDGGGTDLPQSQEVMTQLAKDGIEMKRKVYHVSTADIDMIGLVKDQVRLVEDYKPANLQGSMGVRIALEAIREKNSNLRYIFSGNLADEIGLSYELRNQESWYRPITFEEVMKKPLMFIFGPNPPGGRAFNANKGGAGFSREGCFYTFTAENSGFVGLSPFTDKDVLTLAARIPYADLIPDEDVMANFKSQLETTGLNKLANVNLPVYTKTRLQCGVSEFNPFRLAHIDFTRKIYREMFD